MVRKKICCEEVCVEMMLEDECCCGEDGGLQSCVPFGGGGNLVGRNGASILCPRCGGVNCGFNPVSQPGGAEFGGSNPVSQPGGWLQSCVPFGVFIKSPR